jgi:hypothetical protein
MVRVFGVFTFCFVLFLTGCRSESITTYSVAKEKPAPSSLNKEVPNRVHWTVPSHWESVPASGFKLAQFKVPGKQGPDANISIVTLSGNAGGLLANINRWRGQLGLGPITQKEVNAYTDRKKMGAFDMHLLDIRGEDVALSVNAQKRFLVSVFRVDGDSYFIKFSGESSQLELEKEVFLTFLEGFHGHH